MWFIVHQAAESIFRFGLPSSMKWEDWCFQYEHITTLCSAHFSQCCAISIWKFPTKHLTNSFRFWLKTLYLKAGQEITASFSLVSLECVTQHWSNANQKKRRPVHNNLRENQRWGHSLTFTETKYKSLPFHSQHRTFSTVHCWNASVGNTNSTTRSSNQTSDNMMEEGIVGIQQVPATQPVTIIPISVCLGQTCYCHQLKHHCCIHLQYYSCDDDYHITKTLQYTKWLKKCMPLHFRQIRLLNAIFLYL